MAEIPKRLPGYEWLPSMNFNKTAELKKPPSILALHSGSIAPGVAEFENTHEGVIQPNGKLLRSCYHFAYSALSSAFVQQVDLDRQSWATGGSYFFQRPMNAVSWSIVGPGPYDKKREKEELDKWSVLIYRLMEINPCLKYWTRHSDVNRGKRDPGFDCEPFFRHTTLQHYPR